MNNKIEAMQQYLEAQMAACTQRAQALREDARADEANFEKIRANVYDIFRAVLGTAQRVAPADDAALTAFVMQRVDGIPASWHAALEQARAHDDIKKMHIEQVKLEAMQNIKTAFAQILGGNT